MKHDLEPIGQRILFSESVRPSSVGLTWTSEPTADQLDADDYTVQRCVASVGWWMGDVICKRIDLELARRAATAGTQGKLFHLTEDDRAAFFASFSNEYARARGLDESIVFQRTATASFYPLASRVASLDWTHHNTARQIATATGQSLEWAGEWLSRANAGAWSVAKLRQEMRTASAAPHLDTEPPAPGSIPREVARVELWANANWDAITTSTPPARAAWLLSQMSRTVALIDRLRLLAFIPTTPADLNTRTKTK